MPPTRGHGAARAANKVAMFHWEVLLVSIVRVGLAETKKFAEGYEAIFGGKKKKEEKPQGKDTAGKKAKGPKKKSKK